jgi:exodeoxyribonuclease VII large subunit
MARCLAVKRDATDNFAGRLATHSERHESLLARGYAVVWDSAAHVVSDAATVKPGAALELEFYNGKVGVIAGGSRRPVRRSKPIEGQGSLF